MPAVTSERKYDVMLERGMRVTMHDGVELHADIFRSRPPGKFPTIPGYHPCDDEAHELAAMPTA